MIRGVICGPYLKFLDEYIIFVFCSRSHVLEYHLPLHGGKGGFGTLLRAGGKIAGKVSNKDSMRDLSGRRIREVEAETKVRWAEASESVELERESVLQFPRAFSFAQGMAYGAPEALA